jgi:hypothetical protein
VEPDGRHNEEHVPIYVTIDGEAVESSVRFPSDPSKNDYSRIRGNLGSGGVHAAAYARHLFCGGLAELSQVSKSLQVLFCKECGLRVKIPLWVHTFGDLRECFRGLNPAEPLSALERVNGALGD